MSDEVLEHHVAVDTSNTHPSSIIPRVSASTNGIIQLKRILVVGGSRKTVLIRTLLAVRKGLTHLQYSGSVQNMVGFFSGI